MNAGIPLLRSELIPDFAGSTIMNVGREVRFALRTLRGAPLVSILAIACISLGIGAVTTVYSTASAFTFRPLPQLDDPARLLLFGEQPTSERSVADQVTPGTFGDLRTLPEFSSVSALASWTANVAGFDVPERANGARVSAEFFKTTGRSAALGRTFTVDDIQAQHRVIVLSHGLWQRRFGADPRVVGTTIRINGEGYDVIGVMPADFAFPPATQLWTPLALSPEAAADRTTRSLFVMGRLAPGVSRERAAAVVNVLGRRIAADYPTTHKSWVVRMQPIEEYFGAGPRPFMIVLLAAVFFQLLIACANVANLLLVRATARHREMGLRVALGATRTRLVAQLLTESVLLAFTGGVVGIALAWWGIKATMASVPLEVQQYIPGFGAIVLDVHALVVAAVVSMLAAVAFGIVPALVGTSVDVSVALREAGGSEPRRSRLRALRSGLVVGEIALALMLVAGAALMATTFRRVSLSDPGFRTANLLTATITLPETDYKTDDAVARFWTQLHESLGAEPGVLSAEVTSILPMSWGDSRMRVYPELEKPAHIENAPVAGFRRVSPGYLDVLGVARIRGRSFTESDRQDAPPVIVLSESAARRLLPGRDAVGQRLGVGRDGRLATVIGVVHDVRANPLTSESPASVVYVPMAQWPTRTASVVLHTGSSDPTAQTATLQRVIAIQDSRLAAGEVATMTRVIETVASPQSATAQMLLASAFIALIMAAVGTYGVMAYAVARRTHEIGVRVALGATTGMVVRLVMRGALRMAAVGVAIGLVGAVLLGRSMQAILVDTNSADPAILGAAALLLGAIGLIAGWLPALRATRVDPVRALRTE
jgi:putative ABC transport system permease protein